VSINDVITKRARARVPFRFRARLSGVPVFGYARLTSFIFSAFRLCVSRLRTIRMSGIANALPSKLSVRASQLSNIPMSSLSLYAFHEFVRMIISFFVLIRICLSFAGASFTDDIVPKGEHVPNILRSAENVLWIIIFSFSSFLIVLIGMGRLDFDNFDCRILKDY